MSMDECAWCSEEITGKGIRYKKLLFCSDECCDDYQDDLTENGEPNLDDLQEDMDDLDLEDMDFDEDDLIDDPDLDDYDDDF